MLIFIAPPPASPGCRNPGGSRHCACGQYTRPFDGSGPQITPARCDLLPFTPHHSLADRTFMTQFDNVSVVKKAGVYFDGKCISHTVLFPGGARKTVGGDPAR